MLKSIKVYFATKTTFNGCKRLAKQNPQISVDSPMNTC